MQDAKIRYTKPKHTDEEQLTAKNSDSKVSTKLGAMEGRVDNNPLSAVAHPLISS